MVSIGSVYRCRFDVRHTFGTKEDRITFAESGVLLRVFQQRVRSMVKLAMRVVSIIRLTAFLGSELGASSNSTTEKVTGAPFPTNMESRPISDLSRTVWTRSAIRAVGVS